MTGVQADASWAVAVDLLAALVGVLGGGAGSQPPQVFTSVDLSYDPFEGTAGALEEPWEARAWTGPGQVVDEVSAPSPDLALADLLVVVSGQQLGQGGHDPAAGADGVEVGGREAARCGLEEPEQRARVALLLAGLAEVTEQLPPEHGNTQVALTWCTDPDGPALPAVASPVLPAAQDSAPDEPWAWWWTVDVTVGDHPQDPDGLVHAGGRVPEHVVAEAITRTRTRLAARSS